MWNPSLLSQLLLADWWKIVWINQQSIVPVQSANNTFLQETIMYIYNIIILHHRVRKFRSYQSLGNSDQRACNTAFTSANGCDVSVCSSVICRLVVTSEFFTTSGVTRRHVASLRCAVSGGVKATYLKFEGVMSYVRWSGIW